jgi:hypothetical protein
LLPRNHRAASTGIGTAVQLRVRGTPKPKPPLVKPAGTTAGLARGSPVVNGPSDDPTCHHAPLLPESKS